MGGEVQVLVGGWLCAGVSGYSTHATRWLWIGHALFSGFLLVLLVIDPCSQCKLVVDDSGGFTVCCIRQGLSLCLSFWRFEMIGI
jgi:hypothetical protein